MGVQWRTSFIIAIEQDGLERFLRRELSTANFKVRSFSSYAQAGVALSKIVPDVIVGFAEERNVPSCSRFLRSLRELCASPVVLIGSAGADSIIAELVRSGADDYLESPVGPRDLMARLRVAATRHDSANVLAQDRIVVGRLVVDFDRKRGLLGESYVHVTPIQFRLLIALAERPGKIIPHDELIGRVWGSSYVGSVDMLRTTVKRLRERLNKVDAHGDEAIGVSPGFGYYLEDQLLAIANGVRVV
ncbi:MAG: response regulator transcription factor [Dehalococcoidia bacterium]|nr:response regulator transcription factor [Dehalococcoidia bacterium]